MKKQLLLLLTLIISFNVYSQISFEKGYYINNSKEKIECLIKNLDWINNPTDFEYKLSENSESINVNIKYVREFEIYNNSKYIRSKVKIDKSIEDINKLDYDKNATFVEELLFLKVLVEGNTNLYLYKNENIQKFFYNKDSSIIEQLVYKIYLNVDNNIVKNDRFKQQLWNDLKCNTIEIDKVENLVYKQNSLINFFIEYNKCNNSNFINYEQKVKKDLFNLTFRIHLNNSSLSIENSVNNSLTDFGNKFGIGFGIETEFILPYNKNKWAIVIEPTYQNFKSEKTTYLNNISGEKQITNVDYNSIEVPISLRHYLFINNNSKCFINASYIFDFNIKSSIELKGSDNSILNSLDINSRNNLGFGLGYKFKDKFSMEMRYLTSRNILGDYLYWKSNYNKLAVMIGYSIF